MQQYFSTIMQTSECILTNKWCYIKLFSMIMKDEEAVKEYKHCLIDTQTAEKSYKE